MFEKEAKEEINKEHWNYSIFKDLAQEYWQKGAEFGYNKALEEATHNYNAIAKEIIKGLLNIKKIVTDDKDYEVLAKAEQFISEAEK